jgi:DNA repair protein RadC
MIEKLSINKWDVQDRPREKMMQQGIGALSSAELLAILIGSGSAKESAVELARRILSSCDNSLHELGKRSMDELCTFNGIGEAKAISLIAASELGRRRQEEPVPDKTKITCSTDLYRFFHPLLCDLPIEECWVLLLNQHNKVIGRKLVSRGGITETSVDIRMVMREAIVARATCIALAHNHPSGNTRSSRSDDLITKKIVDAGKMMNIILIDHVIICDGTYYSYADEGRI